MQLKQPNQPFISRAFEGQMAEFQSRSEDGRRGRTSLMEEANQKRGKTSFSWKYNGNRSYYKGRDSDEARGRGHRYEKRYREGRGAGKGNRMSPENRSKDDRSKSKERRKNDERETK